MKPALDLKGDAVQGKATFTARCATCHRASGEGIAVGPDLKSVTGHPPSQILLNIVDPNAAVIPNFELHLAETNDGESAAGIIAAQDDTSITLRAAGGVETTFLRRNLKTLTNTKKTRRYDMFGRVKTFRTDNATVFAAGGEAQKRFERDQLPRRHHPQQIHAQP